MVAAPEIIGNRGLRELFYFQVDNPLAQVCDEATIGYHLLAESEVTIQAVRKQAPEEKVGVVAEVADIQRYADRYVGYRLDYMDNK